MMATRPAAERAPRQDGVPDRRARRLLASIHDVSPRHETAIDTLYDLLHVHCGARQAMLVVPNFWASAPIIPGSAFAAKLRGWADAGIEMFLHGSFHRDDRRHDTMLARIKANHMTAGEGEFLGLPRDQAVRRIEQGRKLVEDVTGRPIAGFIAPAWLYGPGALEALVDTGIAIAEDHWKVWQPESGAVLCRGPVITWASRTPGRLASSLLVAKLARSLPVTPRVVRIGVHPGDCTSDALLGSIDATLACFAKSHAVGAYGDLVEDAACAS